VLDLVVLVALLVGPGPATTAAAHVATTASVLETTAVEPARIDLLEAPPPAEEPQAALDVLSCDLEAAGLCGELTELMLALPFAWHRAGYTVELLDGTQAPERDGHRVTGVARRSTREIVLYIHWGQTVRSVPGAFRAVERTIAHELGHAMHQTCDEEAVLAAWREARDIPAIVPARGHGHEGSSFSSVAEDLAEHAMAWLTRGRFAVRSPIERARFRPAYPGHQMPPTDVDPALAARFFQVCAESGTDLLVGAAQRGADPHTTSRSHRGSSSLTAATRPGQTSAGRRSRGTVPIQRTRRVWRRSATSGR
jgi:hypothetical protein